MNNNHDSVDGLLSIANYIVYSIRFFIYILQ
jgi:hypothetical protein